MRVFVAVRVPNLPRIHAILDELRRCGRSLRTVDPDQLHVTLKFLGETGAVEAAELAQRLNAVLQGQEEQDCELQGLGAFPRADRPSVVWTGVGPEEWFVQLAERIDSCASELGFPREARPFTPHLTLARVKFRPPERLAEMLSESSSTRFGAFRADAVELIESVPGKNGPRYVTLAHMPI